MFSWISWNSTLIALALTGRVLHTFAGLPDLSSFSHRLEIGPNDQTKGTIPEGDCQYLIYSGLATYDQDTADLCTDGDLWGIGIAVKVRDPRYSRLTFL